jgi:hypothetical protein
MDTIVVHVEDHDYKCLVDNALGRVVFKLKNGVIFDSSEDLFSRMITDDLNEDEKKSEDEILSVLSRLAEIDSDLSISVSDTILQHDDDEDDLPARGDYHGSGLLIGSDWE